ncbi:DNA polymerase III subunit epsilon [Corynebacterium pseudodiphtheriticum]|uniref:DNA polymerase III subunit epsilon n=1 Tax=Corynebacterium pseudodiphtheriticum TaxID=37637 RepID=UPI002543ECB0|nr:DNA polymerase III subunit epsilon [Corynebacterium pseudodiphtheriticum]MDK4206203.1 DNA polymerase III subunit epsilon [Corynebacterium pseudodiphtheriticum]MDK8395406.1 DNA polymerase III subunit epsilon [Corynebacterium pseudodiphtheriticum]
MTQAHNATLTVSNDTITMMRSELSAALYRGDESRTVSTIDIANITGISATEPTTLECGFVVLHGTDMSVTFPPGQASTKALQAFITDIRDAQQGNAPAEGAVAGLNFLAIAIESTGNVEKNSEENIKDNTNAEGTAQANTDGTASYNNVLRVHTVEYTDGQANTEKTWSLEEFAHHVQNSPALVDGSTPIVAHNGFYQAAQLHRALAATHVTFTYACTLALARNASTHATIKVRDHELDTIAQALEVATDKPASTESAAAAAYVTGEILVELALREHHRGSVAELYAANNFALGKVHGDTHLPVLRTDLSELAGGGAQSTGSNAQAGQSGQQASTSEKVGKSAAKSGGDQPAPWQAVATPDTVPEANHNADSDHPLFGEHVTLTGEFEPYDKGRLWSDIAERGAQIGKNVTKKTTILVVGEWAKKTSKEKRAEELNEKGQGIAIWPASKLLHVLGLDEEPPF